MKSVRDEIRNTIFDFRISTNEIKIISPLHHTPSPKYYVKGYC